MEKLKQFLEYSGDFVRSIDEPCGENNLKAHPIVFLGLDSLFFLGSTNKLTPKDLILILPSSKTLLIEAASTPAERYLELIRKMPFLISEKNNEKFFNSLYNEGDIFNADFKIFLKSWKNRLETKSLKELKRSDFSAALPPRVEDLIVEIEKNWLEILKNQSFRNSKDVEGHILSKTLSCLFFHRSKKHWGNMGLLYVLASLGLGFFELLDHDFKEITKSNELSDPKITSEIAPAKQQPAQSFPYRIELNKEKLVLFVDDFLDSGTSYLKVCESKNIWSASL